MPIGPQHAVSNIHTAGDVGARKAIALADSYLVPHILVMARSARR